jgi:cell division protein FtsL
MAAQRKVDTLTHLPNQQPQWEQSPRRVVKKRLEKAPKRNFYSIKLLLAICGVGVFGLMFMRLYLDSQINHINAQTELTRMAINNQLIINEELAAQVADLSRQTRIIEIATERGLTFNDNVIRIGR